MSEWDADKVRVQVARDLRTIEDTYTALRSEAVNRAGDPNIPGGAAMVLLGPGVDSEAWGYYQLSATFGRINLGKGRKAQEEALAEILKDDIEPPLSFLASWSDIVREERGGQPAAKRATIRREIAYLRSSLDWMLSVNDDGEPWFIQVDDFATRLAQVRRALENALHSGDRPTKISAECEHCHSHPRLCVTIGSAEDGSEDSWYCPKCQRPFDEAGIRSSWRQMLVRRGEPPEWIRLRDAARALDRPVETIRDWTTERPGRKDEPRVKSEKRDDGRTWVLWVDARATDDTTRRRKSRSVA